LDDVRIFVNRLSSVVQLSFAAQGLCASPDKPAFEALPLLAVGPNKNTFCFTRDRYNFLSHHIETLKILKPSNPSRPDQSLERLFVSIEGAYDLHPLSGNSLRTGAQAQREVFLRSGQHHHAHIAACMAEHGLAGERP
jgi:hydrogenase maturation protein HypF